MFGRPVEGSSLFQQHCRRERTDLSVRGNGLFSPDEERELLSVLQEFEL
jgi:hypothetical protein